MFHFISISISHFISCFPKNIVVTDIKITVKTPTVPERTNRELPNEAKDAISGGSRYPNKTVVRAD